MKYYIEFEEHVNWDGQEADITYAYGSTIVSPGEVV